MKFHALFTILPLIASLHAAEVPKIFNGLFEKDIPVRAQIGIVLPPPEINKYIAKVEKAASQDPKWFKEYSSKAKPGSPLPYNEKLGITQEEYEDYLKLWSQREFKAMGDDLVLLLRESSGGTWTITATGAASAISTLRYDPKTDTFRSPNGEMARLEDIKADAESSLGAWTGFEWKFQEETSLGQTKENIALGKYTDNKFGLIIYRVQEVSSEGTPLIDKSMVVRFALGKVGQIQPRPETAQPKR